MSDFWTDIEPYSESSVGGSINEGRKDQENQEYQDQEQEEVVLFTHRNSGRLRWCDQRALRHIKSEIESSKYKLFFVKHIAAG